MKYSKRDLRAVDVLAMVLVGIGALCLLLAFFSWTQGWKSGEAGVKTVGNLFVGYAIGGLIFGCSGLALNLKLRELQKDGGQDVEGTIGSEGDGFPGPAASSGVTGGAAGPPAELER